MLINFISSVWCSGQKSVQTFVPMRHFVKTNQRYLEKSTSSLVEQLVALRAINVRSLSEYHRRKDAESFAARFYQ